MLFGNYRADQWILGVIAGSTELGLYSVAVAWSEVLFFLPTTLVAVTRPDLVRATAEEARRRSLVVLRGALMLTFVCAVIMIICRPAALHHDLRGRLLRLGEHAARALPSAHSGSPR